MVDQAIRLDPDAQIKASCQGACADYFAGVGVRKLALAMLDDAIAVIAKTQESHAKGQGDTRDMMLRRQEIAWLQSRKDGNAPLISASDCLAILGIEEWEERLVEMVLSDPHEMRKRLAKVLARASDYLGDPLDRRHAEESAGGLPRTSGVMLAEPMLQLDHMLASGSRAVGDDSPDLADDPVAGCAPEDEPEFHRQTACG